MDKASFLKLREFDDEKDMKILDIGDLFLYGSSVINQKQTKNFGDCISYYRVISKSEHGIEYIPIFDYIEKTIEGE